MIQIKRTATVSNKDEGKFGLKSHGLVQLALRLMFQMAFLNTSLPNFCKLTLRSQYYL